MGIDDRTQKQKLDVKSMDINKELEKIFDDPLLNISNKEASLFDIPEDMQKVMKDRKHADYIAQRKLCGDFEQYRPLFKQVHQDLKLGKRNLVRLSKTENIEAGNIFVISGELVLLESMAEAKWTENVRGRNARTRCIYENGTESDILLQTLRKNVMTDGYAVTETAEETENKFFSNADLTEKDKVTGYIYVLRSLSDDAGISGQKDLYKIGFSTNKVEDRIANAAHEPTYLMAPVEIIASYKVVNIHSQKFEDLIHQVLKAAQFHVTVVDDEGLTHEPKEWFVVPLSVVNTIIEKILDGSIVGCTYNPDLQCLEQKVIKKQSTFDTKGMNVLTLNIKKVYFDEIINGTKKIEYREIKQSTINKYTYIDESDGKRYLRRYDALRLFVGYHKDRESALVQVVDTAYTAGVVEYHLGAILEHLE